MRIDSGTDTGTERRCCLAKMEDVVNLSVNGKINLERAREFQFGHVYDQQLFT